MQDFQYRRKDAMKKLIAISMIITTGLLTACSTGQKQATGIIGGGAAGGLVGGAVTGGSPVGAAIGAVGGALLGNEVSKH